MSLRITTITENTARPGMLHGEWGLSFLIEQDGFTLLVDSGASTTAVHNADKLRIDFNKVDKMVLSHGHYDHTGGLRELLQRRHTPLEIYAHPDIWQAKYGRRPGKPDRYVGIPFQKDELEALGAKFIYSKEPVKLSENIITTGEVPMVTDFEKVAENLYVKEDDNWQHDELPDDLSLGITSPEGLVVVLGCAHRGIINSIYRLQEVSGVKKVNTVLGGCHLFSAGKEQIEKTIEALQALNIQHIGVSHCTGMKAAVSMAQVFGERFFFNNAGSITEIPAPAKE